MCDDDDELPDSDREPGTTWTTEKIGRIAEQAVTNACQEGHVLDGEVVVAARKAAEKLFAEKMGEVVAALRASRDAHTNSFEVRRALAFVVKALETASRP
jgi:hypothetical protein